jgi:hypothetical protein
MNKWPRWRVEDLVRFVLLAAALEPKLFMRVVEKDEK